MIRYLLQKLYLYYKYRIYPNISDLRGATRFKEFLGVATEFGIEKIEDRETTNILDENWDNLIILDAARHDTYQREMDVECDYIYSVGGHSREFVQKTWEDRDESEDIIYITANPHVNKNGVMAPLDGEIEDKFFEIYEVFDTGWDEKYDVVLPEEVSKVAKSAEKLFPEKRKIIHFMQPHGPFIAAHEDFLGDITDLQDDRIRNLYRLADLGKITREKVLDYYSMNLRWALPQVEELAEELNGKTVVTADHAELMGEFGVYGHPYGFRSKILRKVPWHVITEE